MSLPKACASVEWTFPPCTNLLSSNNLDDIEEYEEKPPPEVLEACGALMFLEPLAAPSVVSALAVAGKHTSRGCRAASHRVHPKV